MNSAETQRLPANPFCTSRTRPGAIEFIFPPGETAQLLISRLQAHGWWGQIVGPHGTGKTTLLEQLVPQLEAAGRQVIRVTLRGGQRNLPRRFWARVPRNCAAQIVIDGYEQLSVFSRWTIQLACRRRRCGLLITAHRKLPLPTICERRVDAPLAQQIVVGLVKDFPNLIRRQDVADSLRRHDGNLRDALFDLYDLFERRQDRFSPCEQSEPPVVLLGARFARPQPPNPNF